MYIFKMSLFDPIPFQFFHQCLSCFCYGNGNMTVSKIIQDVTKKCAISINKYFGVVIILALFGYCESKYRIGANFQESAVNLVVMTTDVKFNGFNHNSVR